MMLKLPLFSLQDTDERPGFVDFALMHHTRNRAAGHQGVRQQLRHFRRQGHSSHFVGMGNMDPNQTVRTPAKTGIL